MTTTPFAANLFGQQRDDAAEVNALEARVAALEAAVVALEGRLDVLEAE